MAIIYGTTSPDTINGTLENDTLSGWASGGTASSPSGNDTLSGNAGNDKLYGGTDDDSLLGGAGIDSLYGGQGNDYLKGEDGNDQLYSEAGNDTLDGGLGSNTLSGGSGNDTYIIDTTTDTLVENLGAGIDTVQSNVSYILGSNLENLTLTGTGMINGTGNGLNNVILGNAANNSLGAEDGNDTLNGGLGSDTLSGGSGNDTYIIDTTTDTLVENLDAGIDTVQSSVSYTLGSNLENLTLTGTSAINGTGNGLNNFILGNGANNSLNGGAGNDTLDAGLGSDTLSGGTGDDTYIIDGTTNTLVENLDAGIDTVQSSVSYTLGSNLENLTLTGTSAINGTGNSLDNLILGNGANNILNGGAGNNTLAGGAGSDTYIIDSTTDTLNENLNAGLDTVQSSVSYTLGSNLENLTLVGTGAINGTGNSLNNFILGNGANNTLDGGAGKDTLDGGAGNDTYIIDGTTNTLVEDLDAGLDAVQSSVSYTLASNLENLTLVGTGAINGTGNALDNVILGNAVNNTLNGGGGQDTLAGGAGDDTYIINSTTDALVENLDAGLDTVQSSVSYTLASNLENLTLVGTGNINGTGNSLNNFILGNGANNTLDGGAGNDTLDGGAGNDTYIIDSTINMVVEDLNAGLDTVQSIVSYTLGSNLENLTLTGLSDINGTGNSLDNIILGNAADNILNGEVGDDTLRGGAGNDTYIIDSTSDTVTEAINSGIDTIQSSVSYTLGSNLENLTLVGTGAINGTGNGLNNFILGNGANNSLGAGNGDDTLDGGAGSDTLSGGTGNDTYIIDSTTNTLIEDLDAGLDTVQSSVSYTLGSNLENLTLVGTGAINGTGNSLDNVILGNGANSSLNGGGGNDTLDGGLGSDTLSGGAGDDTYIIDGTTNTLIENLDAGLDTVQSSVSYTLASNLENLTLVGTGAINGTGNSLDNFILGNGANNSLNGGGGNDTLDGGAGSDTLSGGTGDDLYLVDNTTDTLIENLDAGIDTVQSNVSYTLASNLENLTLVGFSDLNGTGNSLNNFILGNYSKNSLNGGAGDDYLDGNGGNDTLYGSDGNDTLDGSFGNDYLFGGSGNDTLNGNQNHDILYGGDNNDSLLGSFGNDRLFGDFGSDTLNGGYDNDSLYGGDGSDSLLGGFGNDFLDGGYGIDTLTGGDGADTFYISQFAPQQINQIADFAYDELEGDKIQVNAVAFGIELNEYDRFTFSSSKGALFFDQTQFASLQVGSAFDISNDLIIV